MSLHDRTNEIADTARRYVFEHRDTINGGVDKAEALLRERTGAQHHDRIAKVTSTVKAYVEKRPTDRP